MLLTLTTKLLQLYFMTLSQEQGCESVALYLTLFAAMAIVAVEQCNFLAGHTQRMRDPAARQYTRAAIHHLVPNYIVINPY